MATFVLAHGAWSAGWAWARMRPLMAAAGHAFWTPTQTGLGERAHLASPEVTLDTHIADVAGVIETEELSDVTLLAHSYGGMVGTGVADRLRDRVSRLIYVDAFAPRNGDSVFSLAKPAAREEYERRMREEGEGWRITPNPPPPDTAEADLPWLARHRRPQPSGAFATPLRLSAEPDCPRAYVYCLRRPEADPFGPFRARAEAEGWPVFDIDASHSPNVTAPELLMETLEAALA